MGMAPKGLSRGSNGVHHFQTPPKHCENSLGIFGIFGAMQKGRATKNFPILPSAYFAGQTTCAHLRTFGRGRAWSAHIRSGTTRWLLVFTQTETDTRTPFEENKRKKNEIKIPKNI